MPHDGGHSRRPTGISSAGMRSKSASCHARVVGGPAEWSTSTSSSGGEVVGLRPRLAASSARRLLFPTAAVLDPRLAVEYAPRPRPAPQLGVEAGGGNSRRCPARLAAFGSVADGDHPGVAGMVTAERHLGTLDQRPVPQPLGEAVAEAMDQRGSWKTRGSARGTSSSSQLPQAPAVRAARSAAPPSTPGRARRRRHQQRHRTAAAAFGGVEVVVSPSRRSTDEQGRRLRVDKPRAAAASGRCGSAMSIPSIASRRWVPLQQYQGAQAGGRGEQRQEGAEPGTAARTAPRASGKPSR